MPFPLILGEAADNAISAATRATGPAERITVDWASPDGYLDGVREAFSAAIQNTPDGESVWRAVTCWSTDHVVAAPDMTSHWPKTRLSPLGASNEIR